MRVNCSRASPSVGTAAASSLGGRGLAEGEQDGGPDPSFGDTPVTS